MSQSRAHRPPVAKNDSSPKSRSTVGKVTASLQKQSEPQQKRSKSKNKIPNNIRYDLENALVGLCDVWFDDIKPYLMRNNIKVHVNCGESSAPSDNSEGCVRATQRQELGSHCPHFDPGAAPDCRQHLDVSCASFCSTRRTTLSAPCRRRRVSLAPHLPPLLSPRDTPLILPHKVTPPRTRLRRKGLVTPRLRPRRIRSVPTSHNNLKPYSAQLKLSPKTCKIVKDKIIQTDNVDRKTEVELTNVKKKDAEQPPQSKLPKETQARKKSSERRLLKVNLSRIFKEGSFLTSKDFKSIKKSVRLHEHFNATRQSSEEFPSLQCSNFKMDNSSSKFNFVSSLKKKERVMLTRKKNINAKKPWR